MSSEGKGVYTLQKPDKIYLENTNLAHAKRNKPDIANIRETFVFNQLYNAGFKVSSPKAGDFLSEGYTLEIDRNNESTSKVKHLNNYLVVADDIEIGMGNKAPIWLQRHTANEIAT